MPAPSDRPYDIVLLGATGFAGRLAAEYLARNAPAECRWAIAGRNAESLAELRDSLGAANAPQVLHANVEDETSMRALAQGTRVLATTVGPYVLHGEAVVAACAAAGTDYLDLTGEPEFVDTCYLRRHGAAERSGARLVHAAGFDSVPHDLGALFTVQQLPAGAPVRLAGYVRVSADFSGGTFASAMTAFSRFRQTNAVARERKAVEWRDPARTARAEPGRPHRDPVNGGWALPLPTIDPQIVARSARALDRYGPDFHYSHYASLASLPVAVGLASGAGLLFGLAQVPPARRALVSRRAAGAGPSAHKRARSWFTVTFVGATPDGARVTTRVSGGDPGYDETAKMLGESALCLAFDELAHTAGQVTTATAMGDALLRRLQTAGMRFEVLS